MQSIVTIVGIVAVIASFVFPVGLVMLLFRKHRKRGAKLAIGSCFAVIVAGIAAVVLADHSSKLAGDVSAPENGQLATQTNTPSAPQELTDSEKAQAVIDKPVTKVTTADDQPTAAEAMDKRLAAHLETPAALAAYCSGMAAIKAAYDTANDLYANDNDKWQQYTQSQDKAYADQISQKLGVPVSDWLFYADKHNWRQKCAANESLWQEVRFEDLKAASQAGAQKAVHALQASFAQLATGRYHEYLNADNFDEAKCIAVQDNGFWFAGCKLVGKWNDGTRSSNAHIYEVAETSNGVVIEPFDGDSRILKSIEPVIRSFGVLPGTYVGNLPVKGMNASSVKAQFKQGL